MDLRIITTPDGKAHLYTPYNARFVKRIKLAGGRWDATAKCWTVPLAALDVARDIMRDVYGTDDRMDAKMVRVRLTFADSVRALQGPVTILGHTLANAWGRDSGARSGDGVYYKEGKPLSGGSAKNWCSIVEAGSVVILVAVPTVLLEREELPNGVTAEIVETAAIDRAALAAERERLSNRIAEIDKQLQQG